ncbi:MAG: PEP-CTERM sorting domain-containing protein [Deltaproteobacteria bacterium]|nr:PEP-CTERM sorting domain-containing protein [Deltaproteobacteria bacterium]
MKKYLMVLMIAVCALVVAGNAMAYIVPDDLALDFRTTAWTGAYNNPFWTVGDVTATALPQGSLLFQANDDGLGILGGEPDEVDHEEQLSVVINLGMSLSGVWITDLFTRSDGADPVNGEYGSVLINGLDTYYFMGINSDQGNGDQYVSFGGAKLVTSALFQIEGGTNNNDFSVAGFTRVPEPATMMLLGLGMLGLAGVWRKFKK